MERDATFDETRTRLSRTRRLGIVVLSADLMVGVLDATNIGFFDNFDASAGSYLPLAIAGATLAVASTLGLRDLDRASQD